MKRFLLGEFPNESKRGPYIIGSDVVFSLDFLERHTPSEAPAEASCFRCHSWMSVDFHAFASI